MQTIELKPTAKVSVKKSVLKMYNLKDVNTVYLKDGAEFEVELFNPTQDKILCKISINGSDIGGGGLILMPGQRVFLERYLSNNKKFKYETYEVEDTPEVEHAIAKNGLLEVKFFKELVYVGPTALTWINLVDASLDHYTHPYPSSVTVEYCANTVSTPLTGTLTASSSTGNITTSSYTANSIRDTKPKEVKCSAKMETGRVTSGSTSQQKFDYDNSQFWSTPFHTEKVKILPESQKVFTAEDIKHRNYCSECGKKVKDIDKFCSNCGTKL